MDVLDRAVIFAAKAHSGQTRKMAAGPYILHPMEAATIVGTMTNDKEVIAAAMLHDTVEDTSVTAEQILAEFGPRVAQLVASETENKYEDRPAAETWHIRKEESLRVLEGTDDLDVKRLWLGDKLSNIRSLYRNFCKKGEGVWKYMNEPDPQAQGWYYRSIADAMPELRDEPAWREYDRLVRAIFEGKL